MDRNELYRKIVEVTARLLRPGGSAVLMAPEGAPPGPPAGLRVVGAARIDKGIRDMPAFVRITGGHRR